MTDVGELVAPVAEVELGEVELRRKAWRLLERRALILDGLFEHIDDSRDFLDALAMRPLLDELFMDIATLRVRALLDEAPDWLSQDDRARAAKILWDAAYHYPHATAGELLWTFVADTSRPPRRGTKPVWSGVDGAELVQLVEAGLRSRGQSRSDPKAVINVLKEICEADPEGWGSRTPEQLRPRYYDGLAAQSGKSSD